MKKRRVVVTGMGIKCSIGNDLKTFWTNLKNGHHGIRKIEFMNTSKVDVSVAAYDYDFNPLEYFSSRDLRRTNRFCQFAISASKDAIGEQNLLEYYDPFRVGIIFSSGIGGIETMEKEHVKYIQKGPNKVSVFFIPMIISNIAAGLISINTGFKGDNMCIVSACSSSNNAIGESFRKIRDGYLDACISGGSEAGMSILTISGFNNMRALSRSKNPNRASIPFDKERNGFVMGEGGAALVLEELSHAKSRNATIYGEILGYSSTSDAFHITKPHPKADGISRCILNAINDADIKITDIDYINAHGTSTIQNDLSETIAIKKVFKKHAYKLLISSTKSMTGHMLGAAGATESIATILALKNGIAPPTVGYSVPDDECDLNYVTNGHIKKDIKYAISNSMGFGGHNSTICFS